ncbi:hypothetical protein D9758_004486 [Tetrapyrgos nigripes]|uniref:Golgi apparatus membrane protein TVP38 n=1 Tax=Tetrapyrgos nigripes TaxID=182062 RepID=A0A8H5GNK4_9AGAR|nr:hypothetical protein D9758_004486 [Tetrapyrgos nigripes]
MASFSNSFQAHHHSASEVPLFSPEPNRDFLSKPKTSTIQSPIPVQLHEISSTDSRAITRTPSPTPSEAEELQKKTSIGTIDWSKLRDPRNWWYWVIGIIIVVLVILFVVYRDDIINWLEPAAHWLHDTPGGWLVPIAIMIIISFPPLFGHEIVAMLCGLVWGLGIGFLIVAAGTIIGEMANLYVFRYFFSERSKRYEKNIAYACLVRVIQDGGFRIALLIRYSLIPPHFTTTIFAVCGMSSLTFLASAVLSLPKQLVVVYLGDSLAQEADGDASRTERIVNGVVITVGIVVGIVAIRYINRKINEVKPQVIYERRKARQQQKLSAAMSSGSSNTTSV